jgi:hypothetical protein
MLTLRINITGISCLVDGRTTGRTLDTFEKRVLLPTDTIFDSDHPPHIPYLEIAELDLVNQPGTIVGLSERYVRNGVPYRRFELYGHRVWVDGVDEDQAWQVTSLYDCKVIKMKEVAPALSAQPQAACFDTFPPAELVSGTFDISYGHLTVGDIDPQYTSFPKTFSWVPRRLAVNSTLDLRVTTSQPRILIAHSSQPNLPTLVRLKAETVGFSIGNLPLLDIAPVLGQKSKDDFPHDFRMFYKLAESEPTDPPLPDRPQGLQIACSNTNWP